MTTTRRARLVAGIPIAAMMMIALAPAAQAKPSATQFPYTFVNPDGTKTIIPAAPKRVVLTGQSLQELDTVISLGVHPVGSLGRPDLLGAHANGFPAWLDTSELDGVTNIGNINPDYETVASLHPDLIVTYSTFPPAQTAQLQSIAPTVEVNPGQVATGRFPWEDTLFPLAPLFNATARADAVLARLRDRTAALAGFARGTSLALIFPEDGYQNFVQVTGNQSIGALLQNAGIDIEGPLAGGATDTPTGNILQSTELLPEISASRVLFLLSDTDVTESGFESQPLYPQIPAVKTHQAYFTDWWAAGPIGTADALSQLQKQVFGVTGLEATLAGTGKHKSDRSGVADVDLGSGGRRVCWKISTSGAVGHLSQATIETAAGATLLTLGTHYVGQGCAAVSRGASTKLLAKPARYTVWLNARHTRGVLKGTLGVQSPAFFGNGTDRLFTFNP